MAGAKIPTERRKKRRRSSSLPTPPSLRRVHASHALDARDAARRLGISASTLRRRARAGLIPATLDDQGHYHFAERSVGAAQRPRRPEDARAVKKKRFAQKKRAASKRRPPSKKLPLRKKRPLAAISTAAAPAARPATSATSRKKKLVGRKRAKLAKKSKKVVGGKKKRIVRRPPPPPPPKKTKKKKRRAKKSKRPTRPPVRRPPPPPTIPGPFGAPIVAPGYVPPEPSLEFPMPIEQAATAVGHAMRDYIMARFKWEREGTHLDFTAMKEAFRQTYGIDAWHDTFEWIVDEWDLERFIFDREALRDS